MNQKYFWGALLSASLLLGIGTGCKVRKAPEQVAQLRTLATMEDSIAYAIGVTNGSMFSEYIASFPGKAVDNELLLKGFSEAMRKETTLINSDQAAQILESYLQRIDKEEKETNRKAGEEFLEANAKRPEVKTTSSGLQYEILKEGTGIRPTVEDTVVVHYRGTNILGEEFDSSYSRNQPATFSLLQVIPGWTEGICLLKEGSKAKLYIPHSLGYGERGAGQLIRPYSALIFEVELLQVKKGTPLPVVNAQEKSTETKTPAPKKSNSKKRKK